MTPLVALFAVIVALVAVGWFTHKSITDSASRHAARLAEGRDAGVFRLVFETRDAGRTWTCEGRAVEVSAFSDRLQDAYTNVRDGWLPETTGERRRWLEAHGYDGGRPLVVTRSAKPGGITIPTDRAVFDKLRLT